MEDILGDFNPPNNTINQNNTKNQNNSSYQNNSNTKTINNQKMINNQIQTEVSAINEPKEENAHLESEPLEIPDIE